MHVELRRTPSPSLKQLTSTRCPFVLAACAVVASGGAATTVAAQSPQAVPEIAPEVGDGSDESRLHVALGVDYTNAYFFRGFAYEDTGLILQPWADFSLDIVRADAVTISLSLGTWNSFHGEATDAGTSDNFRKYWFESDVTAGVGAEIGRWSLAMVYNWYTSPSDAFETTEEVMFTASYADEDLLPCGWTLQPAMTLAVETGSVANDGGRKGTYLELGVSPGFAFNLGSLKDLELSFPLTIGLSLSNYYEGENGENDAFGYTGVGAELTVPLNLDESWGAWSITAGLRGLFLGDAAASSNGEDDFQLIGNVGVAIGF